MKISRLHHWHDWHIAARKKLPRFVLDYIDGGAGDEMVINRNLEALKNLNLVPSVLCNTAAKTTNKALFGCDYKLPIAMAPTGLNGLIRPEGDQMIAKAAVAKGVPFILSTAASCTLQSIIESTGTCPWFQLYILNKSSAYQLIDHASALGCKVLVVTVDVPVSGHRYRDLKNGFNMPFKPSISMLLDCISRPSWSMAQVKSDRQIGFPVLQSEPSDGAQHSKLFSRSFDDTLSWDDISEIRNHWKGTLILKGILHPEDAAEACRVGVDGIIVSNHGGRQLESAPASLEMLPHIVSAVKNKISILIDGGIRSGEDILKAMALGADGVLIGRLMLYGLAAHGEAGVSEILSMLQREMLTGMALIGCPTLETINRTLVVKN